MSGRQVDLDVIRLVTEDYFFVYRKQILELEPVRRVLAVTRGSAFDHAIAGLAGYTANPAGEVKTVREVFRSSP